MASLDITLTLAEKNYRLKNPPLPIFIPVRFDGIGPKVFGAPLARREPFQTGGFIGDGSCGCYCDTYTFIAHTNGTHTEGVGHILGEAAFISDLLQHSLIPATLISVIPQPSLDHSKTGDQLITQASLEKSFRFYSKDFFEAVIIRTTPNGLFKKTHDYNKAPSPFFTTEAMHYLNDLGVQHLLVDLPSIDRLHDEGKLTNHRIFWEISKNTNPSQKTITELIYVDDHILDGHYFLNLQIAPIRSDAAPSRPILYEMNTL